MDCFTKTLQVVPCTPFEHQQHVRTFVSRGHATSPSLLSSGVKHATMHSAYPSW